MSTTTHRLAFGDNDALPEHATAAWGARLIVTQDGYVDLVPDRTDIFGAEAISGALVKRIPRPLDLVAAALRDSRLNTRQAGRVELYRDDLLVLTADTKASAGYCYVTAYLAADEAA